MSTPLSLGILAHMSTSGEIPYFLIVFRLSSYRILRI